METTKIIRLQAENIKRLKAVEITPDGNLVIISGANAQGKTSVLDSILFALNGGQALKNVDKPIRKGEDKAKVVLDLGGLVITRNWTSNENSYLNVTNADGAKYGSPQKMLDDLVGRLSFCPMAFTQMKPSDQLQALLEVVDLPIDLDDIASRRKALYDDRTINGRTLTQLEAQLSAMETPAKDLPVEETPAIKIMEELNEANEAGRQLMHSEQRLQELRNQAEEHKTETMRLQGEIERVSALLETSKASYQQTVVDGKELAAEIEKVELPNTVEIQGRLSAVEETNQSIKDAAEYRKVQESIKPTQDESDRMTSEIAALDKQKSDAVKSASFPVNGLSFDETGVLYNGLPFSQSSGAEQLRVSLAMAMALNPTLRVIRITDGSLLDSKNLQLISDMADAQDYQIWIERVDESGTVGICIEDGEVKA